jgi:hypothetical protein
MNAALFLRVFQAYQISAPQKGLVRNSSVYSRSKQKFREPLDWSPSRRTIAA